MNSLSSFEACPQPYFLVSAYTASTESPSTESMVAEAQNYWIDQAKTLSVSKREEFKAYIRALSERVDRMISYMSFLGYSKEQICWEAKRSIELLHQSAQIFQNDCLSFNLSKEKEISVLTNLDKKIRETQLSFGAFDGDAFKKTFDKPLAEEADSSFKKAMEKTVRKIKIPQGNSSRIHGVFSKAGSVELEDSKNKVRDWVISAGVIIGMSEIIQRYVPRRVSLPSVAVAYAVQDIAEYLEPTVDIMEKNEEAAYWWNMQCQLIGEGPSYGGAGGMAMGSLKLAQIPGQLIQKVHQAVTSFLIKMGDMVGLTEENIASGVMASLEFISRNSPELLEQKGWEIMAKNLQKDENK